MIKGFFNAKTYHFPVRVYYEDTDQQGIVFYANYLKYMERGRTEFLREMDAAPAKLERELDRLFVVAKLELSYLRPAHLDDILEVRTRIESLGRVKLRMHQAIYRDETCLNEGTVTVGIIDRSGKPACLPADLQQRFAALA